MSVEDELKKKGIKPDTCEPDDQKLVCETEEGEEIEITKEDMLEMVD